VVASLDDRPTFGVLDIIKKCSGDCSRLLVSEFFKMVTKGVTKGLFQFFPLFGPEVSFEFNCPLRDQSRHVLLSDPSLRLLVVKKNSVHHSLSDRGPYHLLFSFLTRASAACLAAAERCAGVRQRAVALPPFRPIAWKYSNVILVIRNTDGAYPVHSATLRCF
jgi:hypothetical protein